MDKDTKFIFVMLAIVAILVGVFVWKIATPEDEEDITNTASSTNKVVEQNETNKSSDTDVADKLYESIEAQSITKFLENALEDNERYVKIIRPFFIVILAITIIVIIVKIKSTNVGSRIGKKTIIGLVIFSCICGINTLRLVFRSNAIEYAIENRSWYIEKDTIEKIKTEDGSMYIYLEKHGKQQTTSVFSSYYSKTYKERR